MGIESRVGQFKYHGSIARALYGQGLRGVVTQPGTQGRQQLRWDLFTSSLSLPVGE